MLMDSLAWLAERIFLLRWFVHVKAAIIVKIGTFAPKFAVISFLCVFLRLGWTSDDLKYMHFVKKITVPLILTIKVVYYWGQIQQKHKQNALSTTY